MQNDDLIVAIKRYNKDLRRIKTKSNPKQQDKHQSTNPTRWANQPKPKAT